MICVRKSATTATTETETTDQMTIFYAGQVLVFNDLPADKAREVMLLASKGSSQNTSSNFLSGSGPEKINSGIPTAPIPTIPAAAAAAGNSQGLNSGGTYSIPASPAAAAAAAAAPNPQAPLGSGNLLAPEIINEEYLKLSFYIYIYYSPFLSISLSFIRPTNCKEELTPPILGEEKR